ncbi:SdrD B-like domain-containing protein [Leucobacter chromiireducens]|uniref:SdrD B-like domain-containing protein n=1 Tax=Leucobacter chromiireducens TaxID=283877 RepID=UPI0013DE5DA0|nr:SdrD B-like domain-containing protein [Leucobacter chromiireducens]
MTVSYNNAVVPGGHEVTIVVPKGFSINQAPAANSAVESFRLENGELIVKFKDPIQVAQGFFKLQFSVDTQTTSSQEEITWGIKGAEESKTVVIKKKGDDFINFDRNDSAKHASGVNWPGVKVENGTVVLGSEFLNTEIPFTITVWNKDQTSISIADQLGPNLSLVPNSFSLTQTTWDANGLNKKATNVPVGPFSGTSFEITQPATANSIYDLRYRAKITDAAALENVRALLQAQYDAVKDTEGAEFKVKLTNSATVNSKTHGTETWIAGRTPVAPTPDINGAFGKGNDLPWNTPIEVEEDGVTLVKPLTVNYSLRADLTKFKDFADTKHGLVRNVVMTDTLPEQLIWETGAGFLTLGGKDLEEVQGVSPADFAGDAYAMKYMVDGQKLIVNVGKDVTKTYDLKAKASLVTVDGLTATPNPGGNKYAAIEFSRITNVAKWTYSGADGADKVKDTSTDHLLYIPKDAGAKIDDNSKFSKRADKDTIELAKGTEFAEVPFTFSVGANVGNALTSRVIDEIDHETLNVTEENLAAIAKTITGSYGGKKLTGEMFDLSLDGKNLVFAPNANFPRDNGSDKAMGAFSFTATLPTHAIEGNTAVTVKNAASYVGSDVKYVFTSETKSKAGIVGGEMELTKSVYDEKKKSFTTNLRVEVDEATNTPAQTEFVYRIQLLPMMDFTKVLFNLDDVLDPRLEFLGFVKADELTTGTPEKSSSYQIPGTNARVTVSTTEDGKQQLRVAKGESLKGGDVTEFFFKVKMTEFSYGEGIENTISTKKATITPTNDFPLDISKLNSITPDGDPITDRNASFELLDAEGTVVLENMYVVGGKLRVAGKDGKDLVPTVKKAGAYTVREVTAPTGYMKSDKEIAVTVAEDGSSKEAKFFNVPRSSVPVVSVGDYVWIDVDADGIQNPETDIPLENVLLRLTGPDGKPVTNIDGTPVADRYTDANGFYEFTDLPPLAAGESYTVTIVQKDEKTAEALKDLVPTLAGQGDDRGADSSTWTADSHDLVNNGDKDYTLDFGFQYKTYAIGDVVWIDTNKDGLQDENEAPLAGVTVYLLDQDGKRVTDAEGADVSRVTDEHGRYLFDELRAGTYGVEFVLTPAQAKKYQFTKQDGGDTALDSNADPKTGKSAAIVLNDDTQALVSGEDYTFGTVKATQGIDPTWDAGVIVKSVSVGDYVWLDENRDGIQDENEQPIEGVKLVLIGPDGNPVVDLEGNEVAPVWTNADGLYEFTNLPALEAGESYTVKIDREDERTKDALSGLTPTKEQGTEDRGKDSSTWEAVSGDLVNDGDKDYTLDFGFQKKSYAVGDYVWIDTNKDGVQDADEAPLAGVTVKLLDGNGELVAETVTNDEGRYLFDELAAGTYQVQFVLTQEQAKKYQFTKQDGGDTRTNSNADALGLSEKFELNDESVELTRTYEFGTVKATQGIDPTWDAGVIVKSVSVGDYVWLDENRDGIQDENEQPIEGVKLVLVGPDGNPVVDLEGNEVAPVWTNADGFYEFTNLPALEAGESYTVKIDREDERTKDALSGLTPTKEQGTEDRGKDSSTWEAVSGDLVNDGDKDYTLDFGFQKKSYAVGDVVWIDTNKDGLQDDTEYTLAGVTVRLYQEVVNDGGETEAVLVGETTTNEFGLYVFDELPAGTYRVQFELTPAQAKIYTFTKYAAGKTALDSNAGENGFSEWFVLDDTNANLTTDYEYSEYFGGISATQGIDPTWDAGVIVLKTVTPGPGPEPVDPTKPTGPGTPEHPKGGTTIGGLANTGGSELWGYVAGGAALLLLGAGALLLSGRRRAARHG